MQEIDTQLLLWFNSYHTPWLDSAAWLYTGRIIWIPLYLSIFLMMLRAWGWRRALIMAIAIGACVGLADIICAKLLRPIFERPRPSNLESPIGALVHIVNGYRGGRYGFPSCHAANSFALATASALIMKVPRYSMMIFLWCVLNCMTRLVLGVHYPGDLLAGAIVGSLIAWGVVNVLRVCGSLPDASRLRRYPSAIEIPVATFAATGIFISVYAFFT